MIVFTGGIIYFKTLENISFTQAHRSTGLPELPFFAAVLPIAYAVELLIARHQKKQIPEEMEDWRR